MNDDNPRRVALVDRLADHILAFGLGSASLRPLAAAVGTSDRMLLYYFPDKATLVGAILEVVAVRMMTLLDQHSANKPLPRNALRERLLPFVFDDALWPFMQLWLEIASQAARGDPICGRVGETIARGFLAWTAQQISSFSETTAEVEATRLLMEIEGAVLLKSLGLGSEVEATFADR